MDGGEERVELRHLVGRHLWHIQWLGIDYHLSFDLLDLMNRPLHPLANLVDLGLDAINLANLLLDGAELHLHYLQYFHEVLDRLFTNFFLLYLRESLVFHSGKLVRSWSHL